MTTLSESPPIVQVVPASVPEMSPYANAVRAHVVPFSDVTLLFMRTNVLTEEAERMARDEGRVVAPVVSSVTLSFQSAQNLLQQLIQIFQATSALASQQQEGPKP